MDAVTIEMIALAGVTSAATSFVINKISGAVVKVNPNTEEKPNDYETENDPSKDD